MALPYNLSPFALILQYVANDLLFEILALIPLLYMSICVYRSLFKVQVFGPYALRDALGAVFYIRDVSGAVL